MRNCLLLILAFAALSTLAGCGNKGPLYLPAPESDAAAVPAELR